MSDSKYKILLVDDEVDLCKVAAWDFEDAGYNVTKAHGGNEAFSILKEKKIDFLVSDIKMPDGDGIELIRNIQSHQISLKGIFLMTGFTSYPEKSLKDLGMTQLFNKPIDIDEIVKVIKKLEK